jgi:hypothetical protein
MPWAQLGLQYQTRPSGPSLPMASSPNAASQAAQEPPPLEGRVSRRSLTAANYSGGTDRRREA